MPTGLTSGQFERHRDASVHVHQNQYSYLFSDPWIKWLCKKRYGEKYISVSGKSVAEKAELESQRKIFEHQLPKAIAHAAQKKGLDKLTGEQRAAKLSRLYGLTTWWGQKKNKPLDIFWVTLDSLDLNKDHEYIIMGGMTFKNGDVRGGDGGDPNRILWSALVKPKKKKRNVEGENGDQPEEDGGDDEFEVLTVEAEEGDDDDDDDDEPGERKHAFPPNLQSGFGGVDASEPVFSPEAFRANLFNFNDGRYRSFEFIDSFSSLQTYDIPSFLSSIFTTMSDWFTVTGESKRSITHNLSNTVDVNASFAGFGAEFSRTFKDNTSDETFQKYMARYDREYIYAVGFNDTDPEVVREHLSPEAKEAFKTWSPEKIIKQFGTHYMERAYFGGLRIISSTLDTRDVIDEKVLERAIDLKPIEDLISEDIEWTEPSAPNTIATNDDKETTPKPGKKRELVREHANKRLNKAQPNDNYSILAVRVSLKPYFSDLDSHARNADLTVAYPEAPRGWLRIAQFASPFNAQWSFRGQCQSIAVCVNPNRIIEDKSTNLHVVPATGITMKWNLWRENKPFGFFKAIYSPKGASAETEDYQSIGDIFEPAIDPASVRFKELACFHKDVLVDLIPGGKNKNTSQAPAWIWDDKGTGANTDCAVVRLPMGYGTAGTVTDEPLVTPDNVGYIFECHPWEDLSTPDNLCGKTLDWSKVKFLDSTWLN
ncbi:hypothetical protein F5884DRAFT_751638 [Xylogone sp. PMI_703]|nr:hypothetical protein F5884DRAFT_751638 [Xylogone sp. PMI_703]